MNINFERVKEEIINTFAGLGHTISMYDQDGMGPISSAANVKYLNVDDLGLMIKLPTGNYQDGSQVIIYKSSELDLEKFKTIHSRLRAITRKNGISLNVRSFSGNITPKKFAGEINARNEAAISESDLQKSFPHLINLLKD